MGKTVLVSSEWASTLPPARGLKMRFVKSEQKYRSLVENIPVVFGSTDSEGNTIFVIQMLRKYRLFSRRNLSGRAQSVIGENSSR